MNLKISKEEFENYISDLQNVMSYNRDLNQVFEKHGADGYLYHPDCSTSLLSILHKIFGVADSNDYIEKFCFECNFGKKSVDGIFFGVSGEPVTIKTTSELYDLLVSLL